MGKIFYHNNEEEFDLRLDDISKYVFSYFEKKIEYPNAFIRNLFHLLKKEKYTPRIFILDKYLDPYEGLFDKIKKSEFDSLPLTKILLDISNLNPATEFKIITSRDLTTLKGQLQIDNSKGNYAKFFLYEATGKVEVLSYSSKKGNLPKKLHDRWFILKLKNDFYGLHFGPSINNYESKDFTISEFDKKTALEAGERFEELWGSASER